MSRSPDVNKHGKHDIIFPTFIFFKNTPSIGDINLIIIKLLFIINHANCISMSAYQMACLMYFMIIALGYQ